MASMVEIRPGCNNAWATVVSKMALSMSPTGACGCMILVLAIDNTFDVTLYKMNVVMIRFTRAMGPDDISAVVTATLKVVGIGTMVLKINNIEEHRPRFIHHK